MSKRTFREVRKAILKALSDKEEHSYGDLERKVNTNWKTIREHCEDMEIFEALLISQNNKVEITLKGVKILEKMNKT